MVGTTSGFIKWELQGEWISYDSNGYRNSGKYDNGQNQNGFLSDTFK
jgi:hypothetical protein